MAGAEKVRSWKAPAVVGFIVIILTFGVLGGWAATARLDSAVIANGSLTVQSNRKTVQHYEGGIISEILVREGEKVTANQPLFRLDTTQSKANYDIARGQLDSQLILEARLVAERDELEDFKIPEELRGQARGSIKGAIDDQRKQFESRRASLTGQVGILRSRMDQFRTEISGLIQERTGTEGQLKFVGQELVDLNYLLDKNLVQKSRVLALEREKSRLEGVVGRSTADMAKAENSISEADLQIRQLRQKFFDDVNQQISETRLKIAELREKVGVASDVLRRAVITAPADGTVQNLKFFTPGGVARPGEALLEIAPDDRQMVVQARVAPTDVERVRVGLTAEIRFSGFQAAILPIMLGTVATVSADRLIDDQTRNPYFLAQVIANENTVPIEIKERLTAGMPADVIIATGERTVLDYLVRPLRERVVKSMREK